MPGVSGQFFKNFGFTVVVAVLISLAVARLITPMIAAYFLKAKGHAKHGEGWLMDDYMATAALDAAASLDRPSSAASLSLVADRLHVHDAAADLLPRPTTRTAATRHGRDGAGHDAPADRRGRAAGRGGAAPRSPRSNSVFARVRVGSATRHVTLKEERERTSDRVRARAGAAAQPRSPTRASPSARSSGGRPRPHDQPRRRRSGKLLTQTAQPARRGDGGAARAGRAAHQRRPAAARDRDQAAARSRRRSRRDHRRR